MERPPLPGSPKVNPTSSFSFVDSEMSLKSIDQVREKLNYETGVAEYCHHNLMKTEKELVDLNSEANEAFYCANKQKTKANTSRERITFLILNCSRSVGAILSRMSIFGRGNVEIGGTQQGL
ncbi:hypothetical protein C1H46_012432 [Malus baccata]|uniref:Uncharacterized protein n=1 Tax=Malus baccata TaxID=106549 RepID=A0A540MT15_MALBA|nr:hypothetical protein C1H46_012432 [Malus baccata]